MRVMLPAASAVAFSCVLALSGWAAQSPVETLPQKNKKAAPPADQVGAVPPSCDAGGPYMAECSGPQSAVPVFGQGDDADGTVVSYFWFEECPFGFFDDPTSQSANYIIDMTGVCSRTCGPFELRVTSGGQTTNCQGIATVVDTTPPVLVCPPDVTDIWGIPTDPASTGMALATDACHANPALDMVEVITPQGPGFEQIIDRTWTATDLCGLTSTCTQRITLLSPSGGPAPLEVDLGDCGGTFDREGDRFVSMVLYGGSSMPLGGVDAATVKLVNMSQPAGIAYPLSVTASGGFGQLGGAKSCNPAGDDVFADLHLRLDRTHVVESLGLDEPASGSTVELAISGRRPDGSIVYGVGTFVLQ